MSRVYQSMVLKSGLLKVIGQFSQNSISCETHVKFVNSLWSVMVLAKSVILTLSKLPEGLLNG